MNVDIEFNSLTKVFYKELFNKTVKKLAIFSCEASLKIGTGHVMRCLVLADQLEKMGFECNFVSSNESYNLIPKLEKFKQISPDQFWNEPFNHNLLIVDNYGLDINYENHFQNYAEKILVIDDLANRKHNCDILVDQNLGSKNIDYKNLVNSNCQILTGTEYCLLRPEFSELRDLALKKRKETNNINKILVNFGGSDIHNHSLKALEKVESSAFMGEIDVVLGFNSVNLESIEQFSKKSKNKINIHKEANMAEMIYRADLAVAAGGTSAWERCCLGLPTYIVKIADNQEKIFKELGSNENFSEFYLKLLDNYQEYVNKISSYVDGKGASRVISSIIN